MSPSLLLLLFLAAGPSGSQSTTGCWLSCQRNVQDLALRSRVCQLCVTTGRPDAWVLELGRFTSSPAAQLALRSSLTDPNWRVRWAALQAQARSQKLLETRVLADWVAEAPSRDEGLVCLTAARAAAAGGKSTAVFLKEAGAQGPAAAARVWSHRESVRDALEVEVYDPDASLRGEALLHLAVFLGRSPVRTLLEAMARRPEAGDEAAASALLWVAEHKDTSVGRMLVQEARGEDKPLIDRLFAVYSRSLEALQKDLTASDPLQRRGAVISLRRYGPLAQRELERALLDPELLVQQAAARGLAAAEGLPLLEAAERRVRVEGTPLATRRIWLELARSEKGCSPFLLGVAQDTRLGGDLRGEAVAALAGCGGEGKSRLALLAPFLKDAQPHIRAGAVRALPLLRGKEGEETLTTALADPAPEVVTAALTVAGEQRQTTLGESVQALLGAPQPEVREAAVRALAQWGRAQYGKPLAQALQEDSSPSVRVAAAEALGALGGPVAAAALSQALTKDPDSHVQHVARRSLERLGFRPP